MNIICDSRSNDHNAKYKIYLTYMIIDEFNENLFELKYRKIIK